MYLRKVHNKKTGRTHLSMAQNYRNKGMKYPQAKNIETFGYLDELEKEYDDPITHFKKVVEERNLAEKQAAAEYVITARKNQRLGAEISRRMNYGYIGNLRKLTAYYSEPCGLIKRYPTNRRQVSHPR